MLRFFYKNNQKRITLNIIRYYKFQIDNKTTD